MNKTNSQKAKRVCDLICKNAPENEYPGRCKLSFICARARLLRSRFLSSQYIYVPSSDGQNGLKLFPYYFPNLFPDFSIVLLVVQPVWRIITKAGIDFLFV